MHNDLFENLNIPKSDPPALVLESFINELKSPLTSIKGWVKIISINSDRVVIEQALASISSVIEKIERDEEKIKKYLRECFLRSQVSLENDQIRPNLPDRPQVYRMDVDY